MDKMTKNQRRIYMSNYRKKHSEKYNDYRRRHYQKNKIRFKEKRLLIADELRKKSLKYFRENKDVCRARQRKHNYGITEEEFLKLIESQNDRCAICSEKLTTSFNRIIDHDHKKFKVRGLLCRKCNCGIGFFNDNILIVQSALDYLKRHG